MIIEKNRKVYQLSDNANEKNLLLLIETFSGWETVAKGWAYNHWGKIGERGGLAEAGELRFEGKLKTSIETYIETYRMLFKTISSIRELFEDFQVKASIYMKEDLSMYRINHLQKLIEDNSFQSISNNFYEKILTVNDSHLLKENDLTLSFKPIREIPIIKPAPQEVQLAIF
ncbi:hypothetical protein [Metabacillus fastidiosus]|uniref:Uncharacterized protein n=1 Tax=Metabacillus fastidiosus TaxID=1458 RepID=A0ABU6P7F4_9BACI|nr:hypothetical protein [Metabacillus fastidiosus]